MLSLLNLIISCLDMGLLAFFEIIPPGLLNSASIFENHSQISSPGFRLLLALPIYSNIIY